MEEEKGWLLTDFFIKMILNNLFGCTVNFYTSCISVAAQQVFAVAI